MFTPEPIFPTLSLAAAVRDLRARGTRARANAARAVPDALSNALEADAAPHMIGTARLAAHPSYTPALAGLRDLVRDRDGLVRGLAYIARGRLADPLLLAELEDSDDGDDPVIDGWVLECRMIALAELARHVPPPLGVERDAILRGLVSRLADGAAQTRFQAAAALADAAPSIAREVLAGHLPRETHPLVRGQYFDIFFDLGDPPSSILEAARESLRDGDSDGDGDDDPAHLRGSFAAARLLASVADACAADRLARAVHELEHRDVALEALAALPSTAIPRDTVDYARRMVHRWLVPPVTRVRAAYLVARAEPDTGEALLSRLSRSLRPSVRAAVEDARAGLAQLAARDRNAT